MSFISVRIIDLADPSMGEHVGHLRADKIIGVRPSQIMLNEQEVRATPKLIPIWKKFVAVIVEGMGNVPCSDPMEFILHRLKRAGQDIDETLSVPGVPAPRSEKTLTK